MDDRRKKIDELEKSRKNDQAALDSLLKDLGRTLLSRPEIDNADTGALPEIGEYRDLQKDIADSQESIKAAENSIARAKLLEEDIEAREQQAKTHSRELAVYYAKLGKLVLDDPALDDFSASYRAQADTLIPKVRSLEERIDNLADPAEGGNIFTWIGKGAQGMVLRSFLTKASDNLDRLYRNAGEQFAKAQTESAVMEKPSSVEIADLENEIEQNKNLAKTLSTELSALREDLFKIDEEFDESGGPAKCIQNIQKHIAYVKETLAALYTRFGQAAFGEAAFEKAEENAEDTRARALRLLISEADRDVLNEAARLRQAVLDDGEAIKKIQASIDIDDELEAIEKIRASIADKNVRIDEAKRSIAEFESRIKDAEKHIEELRQLL